MRRLIFSLLILCIITIGCSSGNKEEKVEVNKTDEVIKLIEDFEGFTANCKVTYYYEDKDVTFEMIQNGTIRGEYKIEITAPETLIGNTTYNDGESIYIINTNKSNQMYVSANDYPQRVQILLSSFVDNYKNKTSDFSKILEENSSNLILLEGVIDGENSFFATEKLTLAGDTYKPIKLDIYTNEGEKIVEIEYLDFVYNPQFEANYFTPIQK